MEKNVKRISLKAFTHLFNEAAYYNRRFCFILGSGASREAGILTGLDMAKIWVDQIEEKYEKEELISLMKELQVNDLQPSSKNYFGIYDLRFYPDYQEGHAYFERELEKGCPSLGHHILAKILSNKYHNLAITTNFDSLIEDALFIYTNEYPLIVGHESLTEFININIKRPIIAKIHRSLYFQPFNRQQETNNLATGWQETLKNAFMIYTPIVIGYAGGDQSLMKFMQEDKIKMNGLYWCYWDKEEPSEEIIDLVKRKNGCLVPIDGFDQMMFMLSRKLGIENPEDEMKEISKKRIEQYNKQYDMFENRIRQEAKSESKTNEIVSETVKLMNALNDIELKKSQDIKSVDQNVSNYIKQGRIYVRSLRYNEAIEILTKAIELDLNAILAYEYRALAYTELREYEKSLIDLHKIIEMNPNNSKYYNDRGYIYYKLENYDKAINDLGKSIELNSDNSIAFNNLGNVYSKLERYDEAIDNYKHAINLNDTYGHPYKNLGIVSFIKKEYHEAIKWFDKAILCNPNYEEAITLREQANALANNQENL